MQIVLSKADIVKILEKHVEALGMKIGNVQSHNIEGPIIIDVEEKKIVPPSFNYRHLSVLPEKLETHTIPCSDRGILLNVNTVT